MKVEEIQQPPYEFVHFETKLSISNSTSHCFIGKIEKLKLITVDVIGIFLKSANDNLKNLSEATLIKAFHYNNPKYEFDINDCPIATHVLLSDSFDSSETFTSKDEHYSIFLQRLSHSELNERIVERVVDPF